MTETSKTKQIWGPSELSILTGSGIDIGCAEDPVSPQVRKFDIQDGDANHITEYVHEQFDFVYSSHCLEHMRNPYDALLEWWKLVKPNGHLFFLVPDEDLYEQGVFPSRFNPDHKATFTISKAKSWSPVSVNVLALARGLPQAELVSVALHDHQYDRSLLRFGPLPPPGPILSFVFRAFYAAKRRNLLPSIPFMDRWHRKYYAVDQTQRPSTLAQIQCIVRKKA